MHWRRRGLSVAEPRGRDLLNCLLTAVETAGAIAIISLWPVEWDGWRPLPREQQLLPPPHREAKLLLAYMHVSFWILQLLLAMAHPHATSLVVHKRLHESQQAVSLAWLLLGFVGGSEPGETLHKCGWAFIGFAINFARLCLLARALTATSAAEDAAVQNQSLGMELI